MDNSLINETLLLIRFYGQYLMINLVIINITNF